MKKIFTLCAAIILLLVFSVRSNAQCTGGRYHDMIFSGNPTVASDVVYGNNTDWQGANYILKLDVYQPACDVSTNRACIVFAHGGGFTQGDKNDAGYVATAVALAKLGYVVANINYRLGFPQTIPDAQWGFNSAIIRGMHDGKAAIRFMRNNALNGGNTYGIDPNQIFFGGVSAGGIMALHIAYQNTSGEMTMACNNQPGSECSSVEGTSNGAGSPINSISSAIRAIVSISGGIRDSTWIQTNDPVGCFLAHGTVDGTVPYASGCFGIPSPCIFPVQGSYVLNRVMNTKNVVHCFKPMINQDHIPSNQNYVDTLATLMRNFLESYVCTTALNCNYTASPAAVVPTISIAITSGTNPTCSGVPVTFTATTTNGGGSPTYQWKKGSTNVGTGTTYTLSAPANGDVITCVLTSCSGTATSNAITMTVNSASAPAVAIAVTSGSNPTCAGAAITFTATPTNGGGAPTYQWKKGGTNVGTGVTFTLSSPANGDVITCVMTSSSSCANPTTATSNAITVTVSGSVVPAVAIAVTSGSNPTCTGVAITFTATPTNGGGAPTYQWKKGVNNVGTGVTFTLSSPANGDVITCVMTSNSGCANPTTATSNAITVTVSATVAPTISIAITAGNDTICTGTAVTFTPTTTNGGSSPLYQWKKNSVNAATTTSYASTNFANNDVITCVLTSNSACASPTTATSNAVTMKVDVMPTISKSGNVLTSSANSGNQWYLNGNAINGAINKTHTATASGNYTVKVGACTSQALSVTVTDIGDLSDYDNFFTVYPNPNDGNFTLAFTVAAKANYNLEVKNVLGASVAHETLTDFSGTYSKQISVAEYGKGVYIISLRNGASEVSKKIVVY